MHLWYAAQFFSADDSTSARPPFHIRVERNVNRYITLFAEAADKLMPKPSPNCVVDVDVYDVLSQQVQLKQRGGGLRGGQAMFVAKRGVEQY